MKFRVMSPFAVVLAIAIAFTINNPNVHAQNPGPPAQDANGSGTIGTYGQTGTSTNGGVNATGGTVTFDASGPGNVSGSLNLNGTGTSTGEVSTSKSDFASHSRYSFNVNATGPTSTLMFNGYSGQESFGTLGDGGKANYIDGGNGTGSTLDGSTSVNGPQCGDPSTINASGNAAANGKTTMSLNATPDGLGKTAMGATIGNSNATGAINGGNPSLTLGAQGSGGLEGGVRVNGPSGSGAEANFDGNANYGTAITGPGGVFGGLTVTGMANAWRSASGNAATAFTSVKAAAGSGTKPAGQ